MSTTEELKPETHAFQAEVSQLLQLMIHSLYSNKEIFLRELISNASDACDKLRFEAIKDDSLYKDGRELEIRLDYDKKARTLKISDNGIGMSREEAMANLGTIAKSGTREFFNSLTGDQARDAQLIGQFGVGFYSSFIVADKVTVVTRRAGTNEAFAWESTGSGSYTIKPAERPSRGTDVILHLRADEDEFLDGWRLRTIVKKYSDHISLPILMVKEGGEPKDGQPEYERINDTNALWARAKKDISDAEYREFYKAISYDFQDPLAWTHSRVEGKQEYTTLLYIPGQAPFDLWDREHVHGVKLYVRRVFIMDDSEQLMPKYLRFVRGVVDSADLPLNVSREILQNNKLIDNIRSGSAKKVLGLLDSMAKEKPEDYTQFWKAFGNVFKEGLAEDFSNREQIARLLRFASTLQETSEQKVSLEDYLARAKTGQDKIYYLTSDSYTAAKNSPHLEVFRKQGIEVLLMYDRVDEWMMQYLREFNGKQLVSVAKGDLDLGGLSTEEEKKQAEQVREAAKDMVERIKKSLGERVQEVRATTRLTDSPACIVLSEHEMALHMQRLMKQAGHDMPVGKPILEVNPRHPMLEKMRAEPDAKFESWALLLLEQAILAEGGQLEDPAGFVRRMNSLLMQY
ncbi:MAG TPA: molecular chaperone HtpG [Gammaproteobacteria bacterium]|nr:molecular chaperone HtpG [Gammaproteobacteria bacterium]